ncbi:MAG: PilZ domain-containing protein [Pirellulales bacterium]
MSDRRNTYRAVLAEAREAELCVGRRRHPVSVIDESSGGLCVIAAEEPPFAAGEQGELFTDDGDCLRVELVNSRDLDGRYRIGLRRLDLDQPAKSSRYRRRTNPMVLLLGLTLGLYAGFAFRLEPVRDCLAQLPCVTNYLQQ